MKAGTLGLSTETGMTGIEDVCCWYQRALSLVIYHGWPKNTGKNRAIVYFDLAIDPGYSKSVFMTPLTAWRGMRNTSVSFTSMSTLMFNLATAAEYDNEFI